MPGGRPRLLTPEVMEDVRRILPTVLYLETVSDYLGFDRTTIRKWIRRGKMEARRLEKDPSAKPLQKEAIFLEFFHTVKKAIAEGEIYAVGIIKKAASEQWQAAAWTLERRFSERWGRDRDLIRELVSRVKAMEEKQQSCGSAETVGSA